MHILEVDVRRAIVVPIPRCRCMTPSFLVVPGVQTLKNQRKKIQEIY